MAPHILGAMVNERRTEAEKYSHRSHTDRITTRTEADRHRHTAHADLILRMLISAGDTGLTNVAIWDAGLRYPNSRISDLRGRGFKIKTQREGRGVFRYFLESAPPQPEPPTPSQQLPEQRSFVLTDALEGRP